MKEKNFLKTVSFADFFLDKYFDTLFAHVNLKIFEFLSNIFRLVFDPHSAQFTALTDRDPFTFLEPKTHFFLQCIFGDSLGCPSHW